MVRWPSTSTRRGNRRASASLAETDRRHDLYHHPLKLLRSTLDPKTTVTNVRSVGAARQADITTAAGPVLTMTIDASGRPLSISSKAYHPNLGDVVMTTTFSEWGDVSGLNLPAQFSGKVDDFTTWEIRATKQTLDGEVGDLAAPAAAAAAKPAAAPAPNVTAEPIGKGIWLLAGQSHHSVLVEFADHLMLIEAPQSEARTLAVIAKAKQTVPNKPLTQLVTTHHHFDHTAGMRAAISEGMDVITHSRQSRVGREHGEAPAHHPAGYAGDESDALGGGNRGRLERDQGPDDDRDALSRGRQPAFRHDADGLLPARSGASWKSTPTAPDPGRTSTRPTCSRTSRSGSSASIASCRCTARSRSSPNYKRLARLRLASMAVSSCPASGRAVDAP